MTPKPKSAQLAPRYDPAGVEGETYQRWIEAGIFTPAVEPPPGAERFVIIQPPPNVTGALHLGHALTSTLEDVMVRYHRMLGDDTLWLPGADHASIAAQYVLDRIIADEGETRESLGRERYLERMWRFMDETRGVIGQQHRRLGVSADWSRERFTMDPGSARAVRVAFKRLWDAGLAYRGEALVNWCPRCRTTISDLENVHHEETGTLWTIRYHLARPSGTPDAKRWISVATTRPETLLGDVAVAVQPDDERYRALIGQVAILPFLGRRLPIVADHAVDPAFGTGAVKITPAHDPDDYALAKRHGLPAIDVLDEEARINEAGGEFAGLDRFEARSAIVDRLRQMGDLEAEREHELVIGRCDRCGTVVEPRLSVQWFIRAAPLAEPALAAVREGRTRIIPARFEKVFSHWLEQIHDWAVGRQLWWGHRIPAWYCPDGHITVTDAIEGPDACAECGRPGSELTQETDIFDTWFSSGLWPFSTLGWPDETPDLLRFYPTSVLETAYEILFFWVARMMMLGLFCTGVEPFHTVYLHGIVRDPYGQKMSKTKGNVVDPLGLIDEVGADALRFALVSGNPPGVDQRLTDARVTRGRNFTNKLWNLGRFVIGSRPEPFAVPGGEATFAERWIRSRLAEVTTQATRQLDQLDLAGYVGTVHDFAWSDVADWFVEMAKVELRRPDADDADRARIWGCLTEVLAGLLRLLHPIVPFVTEALWAALGQAAPEATAGEPMLAGARWPAAGTRDRDAEREFTRLAELVRGLRALRTEARVAAGEWVPAAVAATDAGGAVLERARRYVEPLARARPLRVADSEAERPQLVAATPLGTAWLEMVGPGRAETAAARRLEAERGRVRAAIERIRGLLDNRDFTGKAPPAVIERERERLADLENRLRQLE